VSPPSGPEPPTTDGHGWAAHLLEVSPALRREKTDFALDQYRDYCAYTEVGPEPVCSLRRLLNLCRDEGILAHLVVTPEGSQFRTLYAPAFLGALDRTLTAVCREYHVSLTNAREWLADELFWDDHHQLPAGAAAFTDRLARELGSFEKVRSLPPPDPVGLLRRAEPATVSLK
jgi:hypothetical protein